jgi:hypothetical protein
VSCISSIQLLTHNTQSKFTRALELKLNIAGFTYSGGGLTWQPDRASRGGQPASLRRRRRSRFRGGAREGSTEQEEPRGRRGAGRQSERPSPPGGSSEQNGSEGTGRKESRIEPRRSVTRIGPKAHILGPIRLLSRSKLNTANWAGRLFCSAEAEHHARGLFSLRSPSYLA